MRTILTFVLIVATTPLFAQSPSSSPVADATRSWIEREAKNLTAAAEEMPADKYGYHPTAKQMTFAKLMEHIAGSNRFLCSSISGQPAPAASESEEPAATKGKKAAKPDKEKLVADVRASFDYCQSALAGVDDSKLAEEVPWFGGRKATRAAAMMAVAADLADHYSMAAGYLRLNGLLPPTAQPRK